MTADSPVMLNQVSVCIEHDVININADLLIVACTLWRASQITAATTRGGRGPHLYPTSRLNCGCYTRQWCSGIWGHQSGHHGVIFHFALSSPTSISSATVPFSTAATCSSRSSARPTPFVELRSLPVPRGRGFGVPSSTSVRCARMSSSAGKEGKSGGPGVGPEELRGDTCMTREDRGWKMENVRLDEDG